MNQLLTLHAQVGDGGLFDVLASSGRLPSGLRPDWITFPDDGSLQIHWSPNAQTAQPSGRFNQAAIGAMLLLAADLVLDWNLGDDSGPNERPPMSMQIELLNPARLGLTFTARRQDKAEAAITHVECCDVYGHCVVRATASRPAPSLVAQSDG